MYWILSLKGEVRWEGMRVHGLALSLSPTAYPVKRGAPPCMPSTSGSWQASSRKGYRQLNLASLAWPGKEKWSWSCGAGTWQPGLNLAGFRM